MGLTSIVVPVAEEEEEEPQGGGSTEIAPLLLRATVISESTVSLTVDSISSVDGDGEGEQCESVVFGESGGGIGKWSGFRVGFGGGRRR